MYRDFIVCDEKVFLLNTFMQLFIFSVSTFKEEKIYWRPSSSHPLVSLMLKKANFGQTLARLNSVMFSNWIPCKSSLISSRVVLLEAKFWKRLLRLRFWEFLMFNRESCLQFSNNFCKLFSSNSTLPISLIRKQKQKIKINNLKINLSLQIS